MKKRFVALITFGLAVTGITSVAIASTQKTVVQNQNTAVDLLTHDQAKTIVLKHIPGATVQTITLESEDGCLVYDMKLTKGTTYYEVEIDARTGKIYQYEINGMPQQTSKDPTNLDSPTLTWQQAKNIALAKVPGGVTTKLKLETSNERLVYEIELIKDNVEYEMKIDATTGEIVKYNVDRNYVTTQTTTAQPKITWDQAKKIALDKVPGGKTTQLELDKEDNQYVYKIELFKDNVEHELEIDATTGTIIKYEIDHKKQALSNTNNNTNTNINTNTTSTSKQLLTHEQVKQVALKRVPGAIVKDIELDDEHGTLIYEVELIKDNVEYDLEINAYTGEIYKCKID